MSFDLFQNVDNSCTKRLNPTSAKHLYNLSGLGCNKFLLDLDGIVTDNQSADDRTARRC